jgi:hypothetical protein
MALARWWNQSAEFDWAARAKLPKRQQQLHVQPEERAEPQFFGLLEETFDKVCPGKR